MTDRTIGSHPGGGIFRSMLVIIIILICIGVFFRSTSQINADVERIAAENVVTEMRQALAMMLYDYAVKGRLADLQTFDRKNPFVPLAIYRALPQSYQGAVASSNSISGQGWFFDLAEQVAIYRFKNGEQADQRFIMVFVFEDRDGDHKYSPGEVAYLTIERA